MSDISGFLVGHIWICRTYLASDLSDAKSDKSDFVGHIEPSQGYPPNSEVISANLLHFKPIFDPPLKKVVRGVVVPGGGCAGKTWSNSLKMSTAAKHQLTLSRIRVH